MVSYNYGSWENFQSLTKDPEGLYILDNGQVYRGTKLLNTIHSVYSNWTSEYTLDDNGFIIESLLDAKTRNNYYISLINGEIKYVNDDLEYISITELCLDSILINKEFLSQLRDAITTLQEITMPTLTVDGTRLIWTASNVTSFITLIPKNLNN